MAERRTAHRHRVLKSGQIRFGSSAVDCTIRDISNTGARIIVRSPLWFPEAFTLVTVANDSARQGHIVWRRDGQIGVAFDD